MKKWIPEVMICLALLALLLSGSVAPDEVWKYGDSDSAYDQVVISPPAQLQMNFDASRQDVASPRDGLIPTRIQVPAVGIDAVVEPVGVLKNGAMDVPKDDTKVGWLHVGYRPGENGSAVMAGHVDNVRGVAVFYPLHQMKSGDEVIVKDASGRTLTFVVTEKRTYRTEKAPVRTIFGPSQTPRLNLITCTGVFDRKLRTHLDRLVVYTELKK